MELIALHPTTFLPDDLIEDYKSCIWTERYSKNGDFQLQSNEVQKTLNLLPEGRLLTLRDSTVAMVVETRKIVNKPREAPFLEITGRSFDTVLDRRASINAVPTSYSEKAPWVVSANKESDAAYKVMRVVIGDIERWMLGVPVLSSIGPAVQAEDAIPQVDLIMPVDYSTGTTNQYEIPVGNLYETVLQLISTNFRGIKSVRPEDEPGGQVGIEIYNGADLTDTVAFDAKFDQFDSATYLLSNQGSVTNAYIFGSNGASKQARNTGPEKSGLDRRVLAIDGASDTALDSDANRKSRALMEIYKYNPTALFDGEISVQIAAGYNQDYFLGDIIKLNGEYGLSTNVRVAEFIRSSDATGYKAYPTFEEVVE